MGSPRFLSPFFALLVAFGVTVCLGQAHAGPENLETGKRDCTLPQMDFDAPGLQAIQGARDSGPYRQWIESHVSGARASINEATQVIAALPGGGGNGTGDAISNCLNQADGSDCYYLPIQRCINALDSKKISNATAEQLQQLKNSLLVYVYNFAASQWASQACLHNRKVGCPQLGTVNTRLAALMPQAIEQAKRVASGGATGAKVAKAANVAQVAQVAPAVPVDGSAEGNSASGNRPGVVNGALRSRYAGGVSQELGSVESDPGGTSLKGEGYKSPSSWRISSAAAEPPPPAVACPKAAAPGCTAGARGLEAASSPQIPGGLSQAVEAVDPAEQLKLQAARSLLGGQVSAYFKQLLIRDSSSDSFNQDLKQLLDACEQGKHRLVNVLSKSSQQQQMAGLLKDMVGGAQEAWRTGQPTPDALRAAHRQVAVQAATQLARLQQDILALRQDFNEAPPELKDHWPSWAPFQTAVQILDAGGVGIREKLLTDNAQRPCSNINSFGWGGPWVGSVDAQAPDQDYSAADQKLLFQRGLLTAASGRVPTNRMQRCKVKASLLDRAVEEMAGVLAQFPELGERQGSGEKAPFVFASIAQAGSAADQLRLLEDHLKADKNSASGSLARMRANIGNLCGDPISGGESVFQDDQLLGQFMSCGGSQPLPAGAQAGASSQAAQAAGVASGAGSAASVQAQAQCQELRASAGVACLLKNELRAPTYKQVAFQAAMTGLDVWGSFGMGGSLLKGVVQKTLLSDIAASFGRQQLKGLAVGMVMGGGMGAAGVMQAQSAAEQATGNYYAGHAAVEAYQGALAQASDTRKSFLRDALLGTFVGHALGGGHGSSATALRTMEAEVAQGGRISEGARVQYARELGVQPSRFSGLSDTELLSIAEVQRHSSLTPEGRQLDGVLKACRGADCQRIALERFMGLPPTSQEAWQLLDQSVEWLHEDAKKPTKAVIERYRAAGREPPVVGHDDRLAAPANLQRAQLGRAWQEELNQKGGPFVNTPVVELLAPELKAADTGYSGQVFQYRAAPGGPIQGYFRPASGHAARLTYAASGINEMMGLDTVPRSRLARINGQLGVLSDPAPGRLGYASLSAAQAASRSDAEAFEFLIGNADAHGKNFNYDPLTKKIQVFDHDGAFSNSPAMPISRQYPMGFSLPDHYSPEFLRAIQDPQFEAQVRARFGAHLTPAEMDALLFRREVILEDLREKGPAARLNPLAAESR